MAMKALGVLSTTDVPDGGGDPMDAAGARRRIRDSWASGARLDWATTRRSRRHLTHFVIAVVIGSVGYYLAVIRSIFAGALLFDWLAAIGLMISFFGPALLDTIFGPLPSKQPKKA
jgi:hypothetical protein